MMLLRSVLKRRISMSNGELYKGAFFEHFEGLVDTRQEGKVLHKLTDILFIVIAGVICGFDEWDDIHFWSEAPSSQEWFKKYIALALSLIHISEPTRLGMISYAVFCLKKKNQQNDAARAGPARDIQPENGTCGRDV